MSLELAEVVGRLAAVQRFPVEPLAGESPNTALLFSGGLFGDRVYEIRDQETNQPLTASAAPWLLSYRARYTEDLVAGEFERWMRVRSPSGKEYSLADREWIEEVARSRARPVALSRRAPEGSPLRLLSRPTLRLVERTYGAPLEPQRLRANLVVEIPEAKAFEEDHWVGRRLRIGEVLLEITDTSSDCIETFAWPGDSAGDADLLAGLLKIHGGHLGVVARAIGGQRLRAGDPVLLAD